DLKAQMQDKNIAISELKKLIEKYKEKSVETQFDKPSVVRQLNAQRIPKPSVLGKPTPFSNSPKMRSFKQNSRYVVPTGRVVVPIGRYIVPAGKVIIIVSTGRLSLVPTGRVLSPGRVK
ncbi:hypothetical protein Tco_1231834, partial [Tanacetum coccineum]